MKQKSVKNENYLERIPVRSEYIKWKKDGSDTVTFEIENKGIFNSIAQIFFNKPAVSYVHLDKYGSFIWQHINGERNIIAIGEIFGEKFGEEVKPLYERLAEYIRILESYGFVSWKM